MIAGQHNNIFGVAALNNVQILVNGIGCPTVPMLFVNALLGGQQIDHFIEFSAQKTPATLQMAQQGV